MNSSAEEFVILLARSGTQAAAAEVLGCTHGTVSRKLKDARKVLGDVRVLELIELYKRDASAGVTLRKPFVMESKACGVCGSPKILQPSGKLRCNSCRNARYRAAHPLPAGEPALSEEDAAVEFVVLLANAGTQAAAAQALSRSQTVVSERLAKARKTLGDEKVKELLLANLRDESFRANLLKPFILNQPICGKCGGERTPLPATGELVCRSCANVRNTEYKARHAERVRSAAADYRERNKEAILRKSREYRAAHPGMAAAYYQANAERIKAAVRAYATANRDKVAAYLAERRRTDPAFIEGARARLRAWKKRNSDKVNADTARRHLRLRQAYVAWADDELIAEAYAIARLRTLVTGIPWEVDHIVPLNSDLVCGLHWEGNLQVIPAVANLAKSNSWWPDMPNPKGPAPAFFESPSCYLVRPTAPSQWPLVSG